MPTTFDSVVAVLQDTFYVDTGQAGPDTTFEDLDLDSLALVELALVVEERLGVQLDGFTTQSTLGEATAAIDAALEATEGARPERLATPTAGS
ncbi:acyl carrier protein [Streptomyces sp. SAJ15]|uniref:acyl carrier protein n=1 Tax=Streptomyces sp. SAJ15 TaxID=2011095 RepID=UPI0011858870|nr:acyl carrier protein [Streptomyces sp. SAJ15]TVL91558.1 acyl carrier protein [Streptomyces sp. SAJ15]